ncbi:MAG: ribonuclease J [Candidatus Pacebacteria bacterium]|nr:ribonuclease J [Candidatus Paceibacterota bacterium]
MKQDSEKKVPSTNTQNTARPQHKRSSPTGDSQKRNNTKRTQRKTPSQVPYQQRPKNTAFTHRKRTEDTLGIPAVEAGVIRIIPLGGVEQVGQNMTAIEYGDDIIIVDVGIEFASEETPGVDYIIPNTKYLEDRKDKIRGLFITHGHLDHIGALPYVVDKIGNPKIYTRRFGEMMIMKRHEEFPHLAPLDIHTVEGSETIRIGSSFVINTFSISHTIPDSMGLEIQTPLGEIVFIEDVRVDNIKGIPTDEEVQQYSRFKNKKVLLLTMDSTSIEKPGFSLSESVVVQNVEQIIKDAPSRLIIGTFASQVERIMAIIELSHKYDKKIVIEGRSMKANVEIIKQLNLLKTNNIISLTDIDQYPPQKIVMIATGAQGEEFAALMRIANKTHKQVKLTKGDTVLLSSSIIPGNEKSITKLKDNLYRSDAKVITYLDSDVHASGHGNRDELKWIHDQIDYKYFMPVHGHHYMLRQHAEMSITLGTPRENVIVPDNGSIIEIYDNGNKIRVRKEKAPSNVSLVDGFSIGDIQEVVIRDRQTLSADGMFIVVVIVDQKTGKLRKSPDIISRGFVYLRESQDLLRSIRNLIKKTVEDDIQGMNPINFDNVKGNVTDVVSRTLFQKTAKRPIVIPVVISV